MKLSKGAKREGLSLNQHIRRKLENNLTLEAILKEIEELKEEIAEIERGRIINSVRE